jgi:hypothetical protein
MSYANSEAKRGHQMEGVVDLQTGDESELARMGYKQELR